MSQTVVTVFSVRVQSDTAFISTLSALNVGDRSIVACPEFDWMVRDFRLTPERYLFEGGKGQMFVWAGEWALSPLLRDEMASSLSALILELWSRRAIQAMSRALLFWNQQDTDITAVTEFRISPSFPLYGSPPDRTVEKRETILQMGWNRNGLGEFPRSEPD